jgi:hypothetical protein
MIMKQKMCRIASESVWHKIEKAKELTRTHRMRINAIADDQGSLDDDLDVVWDIVNTSHNVSFGVFPPEARILLELSRGDIEIAEQRLLAFDPGPETQKVQDTIIDRLKAVEEILIGVSVEDGLEEDDEDSNYTYDSYLSRMNLKTQGRESVLTILLTMQQELNRRTADTERVGTAELTPEERARRLAQIQVLQDHIRGVLLKYAEIDAESWRTP